LKRVVFAALAALALALAGAGAAAASLGVDITPSTVSFPTVTLNGLDQQATFTATIGVHGAGSSGWSVSAWAPPPVGPGGSVLGPLVVPTDPTGGTSSGISWPVTLGTTASSASKIANALPGAANGSASLTVTFGVNVPANVLAGSYATTIDVAVASGP
jgi:hypothetical protein